MDKGCHKDQDCVEELGPGSTCQIETGVCVAVSSSLGDLDASRMTRDATP